MAIKVNDHVIPDWAIEGQAQSLFQSLAEKNGGETARSNSDGGH